MKRYILILLAILAVTACKKSDAETAYTAQAELIDQYISSELEYNPDYTVVRNGKTVRLITRQGEGEEVGDNGLVSMYYAIYDFSNGSISSTTLFETNNESTASAAGLDTSDESKFQPVVVNTSDKNLLKGLRMGLKGVKAQENCVILFPGSEAFGKETTGNVAKFSALAVKVWVEDIENDID